MIDHRQDTKCASGMAWWKGMLIGTNKSTIRSVVGWPLPFETQFQQNDAQNVYLRYTFSQSDQITPPKQTHNSPNCKCRNTKQCIFVPMNFSRTNVKYNARQAEQEAPWKTRKYHPPYVQYIPKTTCLSVNYRNYDGALEPIPDRSHTRRPFFFGALQMLYFCCDLGALQL